MQKCDCCGKEIPIFDLPEETHRRVMKAGESALAAAELRAATGCTAEQAALWVSHRGRPRAVTPGPPCPYCGALLKTSRARQCLSCHRAWHGDEQPAGVFPV